RQRPRQPTIDASVGPATGPTKGRPQVVSLGLDALVRWPPTGRYIHPYPLDHIEAVVQVAALSFRLLAGPHQAFPAVLARRFQQPVAPISGWPCGAVVSQQERLIDEAQKEVEHLTAADPSPSRGPVTSVNTRWSLTWRRVGAPRAGDGRLRRTGANGLGRF